jgi:predicted site-specific integrase-resolvase
MNYQKKGLNLLLDEILAKRVGRLVLTHKDRLLRFGAELVFAICQARKVEVVIINQGAEERSRKSWPAMVSRSLRSSQAASTAVAATRTRN